MGKWFQCDRRLVLRWVNCAIAGLAGISTIATILGCAGRWWWIWELLDHPRPQYCLLLLPALVLGSLRRQRWSSIWIIPLLLNLGLLSPLFLPTTQAGTAGLEPTLRLLNVTLDHDYPARTRQAIAYIDGQTADLVWLIEVTPASLGQLQSELKHYQLVAAEPRENSHGSALFLKKRLTSAIAVQSTQVIHLPATSERPMLEAVVTWAGHSIALLSFQTTRPRNAGTSEFQQIELMAGASWSRQQLQQGREVVMIGDFNTTPWSSRFRQLLQDSQLLNSQRGFGLQPTWNAYWPPLLRIAIDHCLHSRAFIVQNRTIGADVGSDHLPLQVDLRLN
ncbi:MAG TPA: endonuclease/exonuclease/phosphatase family protein [Microcoleaceae cyanobacterium]